MNNEQLEQVAFHRRHLRMVVYSLENGIESRLRKVLADLLGTRGCGVLAVPIYSCVMELLNNGLKAIYKNIYFENYKTQSDAHAIKYATALQLFKLEMNREDVHVLSAIARKKKISADIIIVMHDDILHISVCTPVKMTSIEYQKVQQKLAAAQKKRDLSEYFLMNENDPYKEGAGLGLVLVTMILKGLGIEQSHFSLTSSSSGTVASLVIPLTRDVLAHYYRNTGNEKEALGVYK